MSNFIIQGTKARIPTPMWAYPTANESRSRLAKTSWIWNLYSSEEFTGTLYWVVAPCLLLLSDHFHAHILRLFTKLKLRGYQLSFRSQCCFHNLLKNHLIVFSGLDQAFLLLRVDCWIWIWIYWQTANEGRPRPEELIGNAKTQKKNDTHTHKWKSKNRKRVHIKRVYFWTKTNTFV